MKTARHLKLFEDDRGQALVEGAIGVALMAFTWTLMVVLSVMTTNTARTAMAARHAAWMMGNGADAATITANLPGLFFWHTGSLIFWTNAGEEDPNFDADDPNFEPNDNGTSIDLDLQESIDSGNGPFKATVRFGAASGTTDRTTKMPWLLISTIDLPFMPPIDDLNTLYEVDTKCQWDEVDETWLTAGDAINGIIDSLTGLIDIF